MTWTYTVHSGEIVEFRRCRRAWDLAAQTRQAYAPRSKSPASDFDRAIHEGLAVYYFPAMGDWKRSIVRPLAIKGFERRMAQGWTGEHPGGETVEEGSLEAGRALLTGFFAWAEGIDDFDSILVDHDVWAPIPNPRCPTQDLGTSDGRPIRYLGRIDQLVGDPNEEFWIVTHRLVEGDWTSDDHLLDDEVGLADSWAIQIDFPQLLLAGTIVNELLIDWPIYSAEVPLLPEDEWDMSGPRHPNSLRSPLTPAARVASQKAADAADVGHIEGREQQGRYRRTVMRRSQAALARAGEQVGFDALEMQRPDLALNPTFSEQCLSCLFKAPCEAMEAGRAGWSVLDEGYYRRDDDWQDRSLRRPSGSSGARVAVSDRQRRTVNFGGS